MARTCERCVHFSEDIGECRRFPPVPTLWATDNQHPLTYETAWNYPAVTTRTPSCGEYVSGNATLPGLTDVDRM